MKPPPFEYYAPTTLDEALALLAEHGDEAKVLAGGQSLVPSMNFRLAAPSILIDLNRIESLAGIVVDYDGELLIKAMTRQRALERLERDPRIVAYAPAYGSIMTETIPHIAHPQIRNRGTIGGSLAHADPAAELPALAVALDARLRLRRQGGDRWVDAADFFAGLFTTVLEPEEILAEAAIPPAPPRTGWAFLETARRHGDYAQAGVAARVTLDETGRCREARLVYLSAGDAPVQAQRAAGLLAGQELSEAAIEAAAEKASRDEIHPPGDVHSTPEFKRHLARVLTRRALRKAAERAREAA